MSEHTDIIPILGDATIGEVIRGMRIDLQETKTISQDTLTQATKTNGKVTRLWDAVFGVAEDGYVQKGVVQKVEEYDPVIKILRQGIVLGQWLFVVFVGAIVVGVANLLLAT